MNDEIPDIPGLGHCQSCGGTRVFHEDWCDVLRELELLESLKRFEGGCCKCGCGCDGKCAEVVKA